ncbi:MAG: lipopolysaccharide transport periplasmic protein LptA [Gammaproteobacteria bacterium]
MERSTTSNPRLLARAALGVLAVLAVSSAAGAADAPRRCTEDIVVNGDGVDANYKTNKIQLRNVVISQCDIRVEAKQARANGLDFENTRWTFDGDVRIDVEKRGSLRSDVAEVDFRNSQISKATITGKPAQFEQKHTDSDMVATGRAGEIIYDVTAGTVKLSNDAWLKDGRTEIKGPQIVYDIRQQQFLSTSKPGATERVRITITPNGTTRVEKPDSKPAPKAP